MRLVCFVLLVCVNIFIVACNSTRDASEADFNKTAPSSIGVIPSQAQPVFTWLQAVKIGDEELLILVFSERMKRILEEDGWNYMLKQYQEVFRDDFGDYEMDEFTFEFNGDMNKGEVFMIHKEVKNGGLRVIKEEGSWKVDER